MYEVTVEDSFAAGHYLRNYKGKCENPHGHNYKVRVPLRGAALDKAGLLLDFKDLKEVMKHVIDRLDLTTGRVTVKDVTIWETDTTTARYSE